MRKKIINATGQTDHEIKRSQALNGTSMDVLFLNVLEDFSPKNQKH